MSAEERSGKGEKGPGRLLKFAAVFRYIKPYSFYFIIGMILLVISSSLFMVFPGAAGEMLNAAEGKSKLSFKVNHYLFIFLGIIIIQGMFSYLRTVCFAIVSEKSMADLRRDLFDRFVSLRLEDYEKSKVGELTSRITSDIERLQNVFSITLAEFIRQFVILFLGIVLIVYFAPKLSVIMLLSFPVCVILAIYFGRYIRKMSRERQDQIAASNSVAEEVLMSFHTVKAFTNEIFESVRYGKVTDEVVNVSLRFAKIRGLFFVFIITILFGGIFVILWRGALLVQSGEMAAGDLVSFIIYTGFIGGSIAGIGNLYTQLLTAVGATERVFEFFEIEPEISLRDRPKPTRVKGGVSFQNVSFSYPSRPDVTVLNQVSFDIEAGRKIALVGSSGAGKSTIAQLLMNFYSVDQGSILVDEKDIGATDPIVLRSNIAMVPQEVLLFSSSIRDNILYGDPKATEEQLIDAAKRAQAYDFIMSFPQGFDTQVGDRGVKLSGGQRQRIAIARAILKNPAILVLDEATSSLDAESEQLVQAALQEVMMDRTSIVIAHRLSTIKDVDMIYVLDNGKIIERGTHNELSQDPDSAYYNLAKLQFELDV